MNLVPKQFFAALTAAGLPEIPEEFSVVPFAQMIPAAMLLEIENFIRLFDRVTTSAAWQEIVTAEAPEIARLRRSEVCFFTAWDFHLSLEEDWQLIECNDNGSGFLFAALINRLFYDHSDLGQDRSIEAPPSISAFAERLAALVEREAKEFFGALPDGLFLILDTADALRSGKFYREFILLRDLLRRRGWPAEIAAPEELRWDGNCLLLDRRPIAFIINRATDFYWQSDSFEALRTAYLKGQVYVAPNPFTYATRSDKRLLEFLSLPPWDRELNILPEERQILGRHVPPTHLLREENLAEIVAKKSDFFFKPAHGFASHGVLTASQVGTARLRRLLRKGQSYVAQKTVPKPMLRGAGIPENIALWTDLRVWAYHGQCLLVSGRASRQRDLLDLTPPGGWLPTLIQK